MAPQWETGACGTDCQEYMSACLLAHLNTSGQHIALWLDSDNPAVGWGRSADYPYQEGSFFGNIFVSPPQALYCNGKDFDKGLVPGRLGDTAGAIYKNPYASGTTYCKDYCAAADAPNSADGYKSCGSWTRVVTVWRNFDPNTDYKICNRFSGKCLDFTGASTADGATLMQYPVSGFASQGWRINQVSPGKYKVINGNSGKALDVSGGNTSNGAKAQQWPYNGGPNQMWTFTPTGDGYYRFGPGSNANGCIGSPSGSTATSDVVQWSYDGGGNQQWNIVPR
jgi:hypothetical protein